MKPIDMLDYKNKLKESCCSHILIHSERYFGCMDALGIHGDKPCSYDDWLKCSVRKESSWADINGWHAGE